jgi:hypothetical protein
MHYGPDFPDFPLSPPSSLSIVLDGHMFKIPEAQNGLILHFSDRRDLT